MEKSEQINELATALAKAQAEITGARRGCENPFYKSKYADLAEVWDVIREPLSKYGLSVHQAAEFADGRVNVTTTLMHASGQYVSSTLSLRATRDGRSEADDPQAVGSAITYARRYGLAAAVGVAQEDDDAESATDHTAPAAQSRKESPRAAAAPARAERASVPSVRQQCTALADELGIPREARKALVDDCHGDFGLVKAKLESMKKDKDAGKLPTLEVTVDDIESVKKAAKEMLATKEGDNERRFFV